MGGEKPRRGSTVLQEQNRTAAGWSRGATRIGIGCMDAPDNPPLSARQIKKAALRAAFFICLARDAKCAARASPHALLRNEWAPPFACLSPPLSGQPLNRGACSSRQISRSTPCVDGTPPGSPSSGRRFSRLSGAGREVRCARFAPCVAAQRMGPSLCLPLPPKAVDPRHAWMARRPAALPHPALRAMVTP